MNPQKYNIELKGGVDGKTVSLLSAKDKIEFSFSVAKKHVREYAEKHAPATGKKDLKWRENFLGNIYTVFVVKCGTGESTVIATIIAA